MKKSGTGFGCSVLWSTTTWMRRASMTTRAEFSSHVRSAKTTDVLPMRVTLAPVTSVSPRRPAERKSVSVRASAMSWPLRVKASQGSPGYVVEIVRDRVVDVGRVVAVEDDPLRVGVREADLASVGDGPVHGGARSKRARACQQRWRRLSEEPGSCRVAGARGQPPSSVLQHVVEARFAFLNVRNGVASGRSNRTRGSRGRPPRLRRSWSPSADHVGDRPAVERAHTGLRIGRSKSQKRMMRSGRSCSRSGARRSRRRPGPGRRARNRAAVR